MRHRMKSLAVSLALAPLGALAGQAAAATMASAPLFSVSAVNEQCELTNVSTKPIVVVSARLLDASGNDITDFNDCVGELAAGAVCVFTSDSTSSNPHAIVTLNGSTRATRGQCALFDGSTQTVSTPIL